MNQTAIKLQGANDAIDIVAQLPQSGIGVAGTATPLASDAGFTTVNLRNLGSVRTLVLIDGKRLMPGDPTLAGEAADLDTVPSQLVDRVEVVTGMPSATYGSGRGSRKSGIDPEAELEGLQIDLQAGIDTHFNGEDDVTRAQEQDLAVYGPLAHPGEIAVGQTYNAAITFGANSPDGKGNVTGYFTYRHQDPVRQAQFDFGGCLTALSGSGIACSGSSNSNLFFDENSGEKPLAVQGTNFIIRNPDQITTPPYKFDSSPYEFLVRGDERYQAGFLAHYEISQYAEAYADFSFMDDRSESDIAPGGLFQNGFLVNCNNPLLEAPKKVWVRDLHQQRLGLLHRRRQPADRPPERRGRPTDYLLRAHQLPRRGGLARRSGRRLEAMTPTGSSAYTSHFQQARRKYLSNARTQNALLVGGTAANPVCLSGGSCVP